LTANKNYFNILGVSENAKKDEIRKAYRELAKKYHPDVNKSPDAEEKFKEGLEAYWVLSKKTPPPTTHLIDMYDFITKYYNVHLNSFISIYIPNNISYVRHPILTPLANKLIDYRKQIARTPFYMQNDLINEEEFRKLIEPIFSIYIDSLEDSTELFVITEPFKYFLSFWKSIDAYWKNTYYSNMLIQINKIIIEQIDNGQPQPKPPEEPPVIKEPSPDDGAPQSKEIQTKPIVLLILFIFGVTYLLSSYYFPQFTQEDDTFVTSAPPTPTIPSKTTTSIATIQPSIQTTVEPNPPSIPSTTVTSTTFPSNTPQIPIPLLEITDELFTTDSKGKGVLTGSVKNNADYALVNIQVEAIFYDTTNSTVDFRKSYPLGDLEAGQSKEFKLRTNILIKNIASYEIKPLSNGRMIKH
jgi:hypothetical protein